MERLPKTENIVLQLPDRFRGFAEIIQRHVVPGGLEHLFIQLPDAVRALDEDLSGELEDPGKESSADGDGDGGVKAVLGGVGDFHVQAEFDDDMVHHAGTTVQRDGFSLSAVHPGDPVGVVLQVEAFRRRDGILVADLRDQHSVQPEGNHFLPLVGPAHHVVPVIFPEGSVRGEDIGFPAMPVDPLLGCVVVVVFEGDLLLLPDGGGDPLEALQQLIVLRFDPLRHEEIRHQLFPVLVPGEAGQLPDDLPAPLRRDEPGGGDRVDQDAQLRLVPFLPAVEIARGYAVLPDDHDIVSDIPEYIDILANRPGIRGIAFLPQKLSQLPGGNQMLLVRVLGQILQKKGNTALVRHLSYS